MKRNINNFSQPVLDFIELLSFDIKEIYLMGTMSEKRLKFASDYDLFESVKTKHKNIDDALQFYEDGLKTIIKDLLKQSDCYISGIMLGIQDDKPKKWKIKELLTSDLKPYIQQNTLIKIDAIKLIDGTYSDFSCVYQFYNNGKLINNYQLFKSEDLQKDIEKFKEEGNYYKMAKREYAMGGNEKYVELFNSDLGRLSLVISNLETIIFMLENHKVSLIKVNNEIDMIINKLNSIHSVKSYLKDETKYVNILKKIEDISNKKIHYKKLIKIIYSIVKPLNQILQKDAKKWLINNNLFN